MTGRASIIVMVVVMAIVMAIVIVVFIAIFRSARVCVCSTSTWPYRITRWPIWFANLMAFITVKQFVAATEIL